MEIFAGAGGLTAAVARRGLRVHSACDVRRGQGELVQLSQGDLLDNEVYRSYLRMAKRGVIRWVHGGPPCKTFSRARRSDRHGTARTLRSVQFPAGLPHVRDPRVRDANELAKRMCKLARVVHRVGGFWSIENPEQSLMWLLPALVSLKGLRGVRFIVGDQCCHGFLYRKPTGWLTNAEFLEVFRCRCPGEPQHPRHPALEGWAVAPDGRERWLTEFAAEYPEDVCDVAAQGYSRVAHVPMVPARALA